MIESIWGRYRRWGLPELLERYSDIRIVPCPDDTLVLAGHLHFRAFGPTKEELADKYNLELCVPPEFPRSNPTARECGGRIPPTFHKLEGDLLCLGAAIEIRMKLTLSPTLLTFVEQLVIPYLFGYSHYEKHGTMPFGELSHGRRGILECLAEMFRSPRVEGADEFVRLASMKKREANRESCPCRSGLRVGRCHNRIVNDFRRRLGRTWFCEEYARLLQSLGSMATPRKTFSERRR
jgi:hypothetical protein